MKHYETERLILREWQDQDLEPLIKINQDPKVMEFFPSILTPNETSNFIEKVKQHFESYGYGFYACALKATGTLIGWVGLRHINTGELPFAPCIEIGWRLDHQYWGQGLAFEAAQQSLMIGLTEFNLDEIVTFTAIPNIRSQNLMQRLQFIKQENFYHPKLPHDHWLCEHVLYRRSHHD
jgi:RimJ/RimL family protein N-acetyltransferase